MVENLCVMGTLCQGAQPRTSCTLCIALTEVEVGEGASQRARVGTRLQESFTQGHTLLEPAGTKAEAGGGVTGTIPHHAALPVVSLTFAVACREE